MSSDTDGGASADAGRYVDESIDFTRPSWMGTRPLSLAPFSGAGDASEVACGGDEDGDMYDAYESGVLAGDETRNKRRSMELKNVELSIPKTELVNHSSGVYTLFSIEVNISIRIWTIKRRFSDFHYLHQSLTKGLSSALLADFPKLPPKRYFGSSTSSQFVEERRRALETYLQSLLLAANVWKKSDLARFLDNENNNMIFIWNLERMNVMQTVLKTMTIENKNETSSLKMELKSANEQVQFLQERIGRMEMLFLQHATGVASERLPSSILSSISVGLDEGSNANTPPRNSGRQLRRYSHGASTNFSAKPDKVSKDDLTLLSSSPVSSSLSSITNASEGRSSTRYTTALGGSPVAYSRTNTFNSSTVSHTNSMGTTFSDSNSSITESSVLSDESVMMREKEMDAALVSHLHAGRSMSVEQVQLVLDLTKGHTLRPASKEWRAKSADELKMVAVSMHLQQALKLSCALLDEDVAGMTAEPSLGASKENITAASLCLQLNNTLRDVTIENIRDITNTSHAQILACLPSADFDRAYRLTDQFVGSHLVPSRQSLESRHKIYQYLRGLISTTLPGSNVFPVGSFASNTFLAAGDVDVTAVLPHTSGHTDSWFVKINEALCYSSNHTYHHFANPPSSSSSSNNNKRGGNYNSTDKINVQQVAFVNAEIKLVKSLINGVSIDVSCNQIGALYGQALIERLDELVSQDHLLKRSILLIKQWCQVDAVAFCGAAGSAAGSLGGGLLGAKDGRLSTWSLVIMILHIFRSHSAVLKHPLQVLGFFLDCYSKFNWNKCALTVDGPASAVDLSPLAPPGDEQLNSSAEFLAAFDSIVGGLRSRHAAVRDAAQARSRHSSLPAAGPGFHRRGLCNVMDPTSPLNNAARSVDLQGFQAIVALFQGAFVRFETLMRECPILADEAVFLRRLFPVSLGTGDVSAAPLPPAGEEPLRSQSGQIEISLRYAEFVLGMVVHPEIVARIVAQILLVKGPMPIGEVGKQLQAFFGSDDLMRAIKEEFGGLKKLIEGCGGGDIAILSDHPYNPTLDLSQAFRAARDSSSAATSSSSCCFDHVVDFFSQPFAVSGPAPTAGTRQHGSRSKNGSSSGHSRQSSNSNNKGSDFKRSNSNTGSHSSNNSGHSSGHLQQAVHFMQPVYEQGSGIVPGYYMPPPMYGMVPMQLPSQELFLFPPQQQQQVVYMPQQQKEDIV